MQTLLPYGIVFVSSCTTVESDNCLIKITLLYMERDRNKKRALYTVE
jgi:hypothetical protein